MCLCLGDFFHVSMTGCSCVSKTSKLVLKTKQKTFLYSLRSINTVIFNIKKKFDITFNKHCGTLNHMQM